jgi:hypothetical protein
VYAPEIGRESSRAIPEKPFTRIDGILSGHYCKSGWNALKLGGK